jgi:hypothetical protein
MAELSRTIRAEQRASCFAKFGESITYRRTADSISLTTGVITASNTDATIDEVLIGEVTARQVRDSAGKYLAGDAVFRIQDGDMPETPPKITSKIVFDSSTYIIIGHIESSDRNVWDVVARKS